jgi:peroxin-10
MNPVNDAAQELAEEPVTSVSSFSEPTKFDIIRSNSKDKYYQLKQLNLIKSILSTFPSTQLLLTKLHDELKLISDFIYYYLTTFFNRQTLGEECYYLVEFNRQTRNLPSRKSRLFMIIFKLATPYVLKKLATLAQANVCQLVLTLASKLNYLIFLMSTTATYFNLENRLTQINYLSLNGNRRAATSGSRSIKLIAIFKSISLVIFSVNLAKYLIRTAWKSPVVKKSSEKEVTGTMAQSDTAGDEEASSASSPAKSSIKCSICLEKLKSPTLTSCGHLFCWACIQKHAASNSSSNNNNISFNCPSCRLLVKSSKLVFLNNY